MEIMQQTGTYIHDIISVATIEENKTFLQNKQTPWPLVHKRTIFFSWSKRYHAIHFPCSDPNTFLLLGWWWATKVVDGVAAVVAKVVVCGTLMLINKGLNLQSIPLV
jgi:hypothetical protein